MSKVGKALIDIPDGTEVTSDDGVVIVKGPKGELRKILPREIDVDINDSQVAVINKKKSEKARALHGTFRALIANMVKGVSEGWVKDLELVGTGYRAEVQGETLILTVGFSHPVKIEAPQGISFNVQKTDISVQGIDKEMVGQVAATIRGVRPPEPYKGKGIKYKDEVVRRKPGKAAKAAGAAA